MDSESLDQAGRHSAKNVGKVNVRFLFKGPLYMENIGKPIEIRFYKNVFRFYK